MNGAEQGNRTPEAALGEFTEMQTTLFLVWVGDFTPVLRSNAIPHQTLPTKVARELFIKAPTLVTKDKNAVAIISNPNENPMCTSRCTRTSKLESPWTRPG